MIKRLLFLSVIIISVSSVKAQNESSDEFKTLFSNNGKTSVSGFGGLITEFSSIDNNFAFSMGGEGAVLFNQSFFFGGYGMGTTNFPTYELTEYNWLLDQNLTVKKNIIFGHGGFYTGFVFMPNKPIHFGVSSKFGWGAISLIDEFYNSNHYPRNEINETMVDPIFVITPQAEIEMNFTSWFKINFGIGYRIVTGVDATYFYVTTDSGANALVEKTYFESDAFNSATFSIGFVFGGFK